MTRRERLRTTYRLIAEAFALDTREIAGALYGGNLAAARRDLRAMEKAKVLGSSLPNWMYEGKAAQDGGRYSPEVWQTYFDVPSEGPEALERAMARFDEAFNGGGSDDG